MDNYKITITSMVLIIICLHFLKAFLILILIYLLVRAYQNFSDSLNFNKTIKEHLTTYKNTLFEDFQFVKQLHKK